VLGTINMTRASYPLMKARGGGAIINVIGNAARTHDPNYICGVTGNAGLTAFTEAIGSGSMSTTKIAVAALRGRRRQVLGRNRPPWRVVMASARRNALFPIGNASEGTFWLTVLAKTKVAFASLVYIAPLFYDEGRQAILESVRATRDLKKLEVKTKEMDLTFQGAAKIIDLVQRVEKIKDPHVREKVREALSINVRIRVDESVRAAIPPLAQKNLTIEPDRSQEAKELALRSPPERAVPIIFIIVGALTVPMVLQMIREALRQSYYGGVIIDMRTEPPSVTSDPKIPGNMVFVIETGGKTTRYTSDQLSPELIGALLKAK
jgi:hypothetical protein